MKKLKETLAVLTVSTLFAGPAFAGVFTYDVVLGGNIGAARLDIDSTRGVATYKGDNIDVRFDSQALKGFDGANDTLTAYLADSVSGTVTNRAGTFDLLYSAGPDKHTQFKLSSDHTRIWTYLATADGGKRNFDTQGLSKRAPTTTVDVDQTGSVPVPATILLLLTGLAGIGVASRRKPVKA